MLKLKNAPTGGDWEATPEPGEGDLCMNCAAGELEYTYPEDHCCSCHTMKMPPCWACENQYLSCCNCGAEHYEGIAWMLSQKELKIGG